VGYYIYIVLLLATGPLLFHTFKIWHDTGYFRFQGVYIMGALLAFGALGIKAAATSEKKKKIVQSTVLVMLAFYMTFPTNIKLGPAKKYYTEETRIRIHDFAVALKEQVKNDKVIIFSSSNLDNLTIKYELLAINTKNHYSFHTPYTVDFDNKSWRSRLRKSGYLAIAGSNDLPWDLFRQSFTDYDLCRDYWLFKIHLNGNGKIELHPIGRLDEIKKNKDSFRCF
jgi:hypothetical protein